MEILENKELLGKYCLQIFPSAAPHTLYDAQVAGAPPFGGQTAQRGPTLFGVKRGLFLGREKILFQMSSWGHACVRFALCARVELKCGATQMCVCVCGLFRPHPRLFFCKTRARFAIRAVNRTRDLSLSLSFHSGFDSLKNCCEYILRYCRRTFCAYMTRLVW